MRRIGLAVKIILLVLFQATVVRFIALPSAPYGREVAICLLEAAVVVQVVEWLLQRKPASPPAAETRPQVKVEPKPAPAKPPSKPARSEAVTLLAALQREARFIDFIKEPLDSFSDAQIGAAVRDVHRDCAAVLNRLFAIRALNDQEEGSTLEVPAGFDAGRYHLTGNVAGNPPFRGRLVHHGWEAGEVQLPAWSGTPQSARVIAPIEVELS